MKRSGVARRLLLLPLVVGGCFYGFAGGGLPEHIDTVAIVPFENETATPQLPREIFEALNGELQRRLGVRPAPESRADAVVRGTILRYDIDIPVAYSADPRLATTASRKLELEVSVEIIDQASGRPLWQRQRLTLDGQYAEGAEAQGLRDAIEKLVNDIIEGAQSQW